MATLNESVTLGDALKWEQPNYFSRRTVTIASGQDLAMLQVVGKNLRSTPATGTPGANTGNGICGSVFAGKLTKLGTYTLTCKTQAADGGVFSVVDPDEEDLPDASVGVAYESQSINFTIADGSIDFIVGDSFTITVTAGSGKYMALNPEATDGTEIAAGFLMAPANASAADKAEVIIERDARVAMDNLVWPADISGPQKSEAIAELERIGIKSVELA